MKYFFSHSPFLVTLLFTLSFLSLARALNTAQVEVMRNICNIAGSYFDYCNPISDPCQWQGVSCTENGGDDVVRLDLSDFYVYNTSIWQYVCKLPALQLLDLSNHDKLDGPIPECVGSFANLRVLRLSFCSFSESIPFQLFSLSNLQTMDLSNNQLTGFIPFQSFSLSNLRTLDLSNNQLTGFIPSQLFSLTNLEDVDLSFNRLSGEIPQNFSRNLFRLSMENNSLTGSISSAVSNARNLTYLVMSDNFLNGPIPEQLASCTQLKELRLDRNKLTGRIPSGIGNLPLLGGTLDLSHNSLTGEIPMTLSNLKFIKSLDLSDNMLTGEIPQALGTMNQLKWLDLSSNMLTGEIPEAFVNMSRLNWLDLSNNNLTEKIPESLKRIELADNIQMGKSHSTFKILGAVGAVAVFIICFLVLGVLWKRNLQSRAEFKETIRKILEKVEHPRISYEQLLAATNRFHNFNLIATSSFGSVYKGFLPDGTRVAVKVLNLMHEQSEKIFRAECRVLQKARHRNLAKIITTCSNLDFKALVFEYFTKGNLEKHLYLHSCRLGLRKLVSIATDVANAVEYLHYDCFVQIVHCDIKPSNVLLDESMTAHLSDYGISRLIGQITANSVTSTIDLKGSVGYIAPEYGLTGVISPRGDVYSYGILLLEMLTRRRPTDNMFDGDLNLHNWVKRAFPDRAFEVLDESLLLESAGQKTEECLISLMRLGLLCSNDSPEARPTMRDVSNVLKVIQEDFTTDTSSIKLKPTISNLVCDRGAITNNEEISDTQSSTF